MQTTVFLRGDTKLRKVKILISLAHILGFPGSSAGKESTCNVGDLGLVPGGGNGHPLQYSGLENSVDYSAWGRKESDTTE